VTSNKCAFAQHMKLQYNVVLEVVPLYLVP